MGGGLQTALNALVASANAKKHIILFTDGMQNCSPMVRELAPDGVPPEPNHDIRNEPVNYAAGVNCDSTVAGGAGTSLESYLTANNIKIHTIGTGVSGVSWQNLLTSIANETSGESHFTSAPDLDLFRFYEEDLVTALAGDTVELVKYTTGTMSRGQKEKTEQFTINTFTKRASFVLSWRNPTGSTLLTMHLVSPNGAVVYPTSSKSSNYYHVYTFDFPLYQQIVNGDGTWVDHQGVWSMVIKSANTSSVVTYDASLLVDEMRLEYEFQAVKQDYGTGDAILLTAKVTENNRPVHTLSKAQVSVVRPQLGTGTFLSTNYVSKQQLDASLPVHQDHFTYMADKKAYVLMQDPAKRAMLSPLNEVVTLFDDGLAEHGDTVAGDGIFSASVTNTHTPGQYSFTFQVAGNTARNGDFSRTRMVSTLVRVKDISIKHSDVNAVVVRQGPEGDVVAITVTPFDRYKNYLGPGYSRVVEITAVTGVFDGEVVDRLDGTYSRQLKLTSLDVDPQVAIKVEGQGIYQGSLSGLMKRRYAVSFHSGISIPSGNFANNYTSSYSYLLDLDYYLKPQLAAVATLGYHHFSAANATVSDTYWLSLTGNLKYEFSMAPWKPYATAGIGVYDPRSGSSEIGLNIGLGVDYVINQAFWLEAGVDYHNVFTSGSSTRFFVPRWGVIYKF